ncbi:MAG: PAS domain S-box protein, partial [Solirubrobacteraceae bacterium]
MRPNRFGLARRLWVAAAIAAVLGAAVLVTLAGVSNSRRDALERVTAASETLAAAQTLQRHLVDMETGIRGYLPTGDRALLAPWSAGLRAVPHDFATLERLTHDGRGHAMLAQLQATLYLYTDGYARQLIAQAPIVGPRLDLIARLGNRLLEPVRVRFQAFDAIELGTQRAATRAANAAGRNFTLAVAAGALAWLLGLLGLIAYVQRAVLGPIRRVISACAELASGERSAPVVPEGAPELRSLAQAFNDMSQQVADRLEAEAERRALTEELMLSEERQRLLIGNLPDTLVALYDRDLRCLLLDGPVLRASGLDRNDFVGRPIVETLPAEQFAVLEPLIRSALEGESGRIEYASSLSGLTYELDAAPYRDASGEITGAFAVGRDVTERNRTARALAQSEEFFRATVEHAPTGIAIGGLDRTWLHVNRALCEMLGFSETELLAMSFGDVTHPDDRAADEDHVARLFAGEISEYRLHKRYRHRDGSTVWAQVTVALLRDRHGEPLH